MMKVQRWPTRGGRLLARGSGGLLRGGIGGIYEHELLDAKATVTYRGERDFCKAAGGGG